MGRKWLAAGGHLFQVWEDYHEVSAGYQKFQKFIIEKPDIEKDSKGQGGDLISRNHKLLVVAMLVMMNFSANMDHVLNQEKLSLEYIETTHSDRGLEEMVETESEEEKEKKSHKSKPGARQISKE